MRDIVQVNREDISGSTAHPSVPTQCVPEQPSTEPSGLRMEIEAHRILTPRQAGAPPPVTLVLERGSSDGASQNTSVGSQTEVGSIPEMGMAPRPPIRYGVNTVETMSAEERRMLCIMIARALGEGGRSAHSYA